MKSLLRNLMITTVLTAGWVGSASADAIDFTDGYGNGLATFSKNVDENGASTGVVATFSGVLTEPGSIPGNVFYADNSFGLAIGAGYLGYSWNVLFNQTVVLTGWQTIFSNAATATITGSGVDFTYQFPPLGPPAYTEFVLPLPLTFLAGETYNFYSPNRSSPGTYNNVGTFSQWYLESPEPVPEPATLALLAAALAALAFRHGGASSAHKKTAV